MLIAVTTRYLPEKNDARLAARPAHRAWLAQLKQDGLLVNAGPFADGDGALLIFDVVDEGSLDQILPHDPYPAGSLKVVSKRPWNALFDF